jgi:signal transduction histidine kinase
MKDARKTKVESQEGQGSTFTVILPVKEAMS